MVKKIAPMYIKWSNILAQISDYRGYIYNNHGFVGLIYKRYYARQRCRNRLVASWSSFQNYKKWKDNDGRTFKKSPYFKQLLKV